MTLAAATPSGGAGEGPCPCGTMIELPNVLVTFAGVPSARLSVAPSPIVTGVGTPPIVVPNGLRSAYVELLYVPAASVPIPTFKVPWLTYRPLVL